MDTPNSYQESLSVRFSDFSRDIGATSLDKYPRDFSKFYAAMITEFNAGSMSRELCLKLGQKITAQMSSYISDSRGKDEHSCNTALIALAKFSAILNEHIVHLANVRNAKLDKVIEGTQGSVGSTIANTLIATANTFKI